MQFNNRQSAIFSTRLGVEIPRQILSRLMGMAAANLEAVYRRIRTGVMGGGSLRIDETPVESLDPGMGRTAQGCLRTSARPGGDVLFHWETGHGAEYLSKVLPADFGGTLRCDGYSAHEAFARRHSRPITLAGCRAPARRKFHEAVMRSPRVAGWILLLTAAVHTAGRLPRPAAVAPGPHQTRWDRLGLGPGRILRDLDCGREATALAVVRRPVGGLPAQ